MDLRRIDRLILTALREAGNGGVELNEMRTVLRAVGFNDTEIDGALKRMARRDQIVRARDRVRATP